MHTYRDFFSLKGCSKKLRELFHFTIQVQSKYYALRDNFKQEGWLYKGVEMKR